MNKMKLLRIWNLLLALAFLGVILGIGLAKLTGNGAFYEAHESFGIAFVVLAFGHILLNWGWIKNALVGKKAQSTKR
jgi:hypothetical protein